MSWEICEAGREKRRSETCREANRLSDAALRLRDQGRAEDAAPLLCDAVLLERRVHGGEDHQDVAGELLNLGSLYLQLRRYDLAEPALREALGMYRRLSRGLDTAAVKAATLMVAILLQETWRHRNAVPLLREYAHMCKRMHADTLSTSPAASEMKAGRRRLMNTSGLASSSRVSLRTISVTGSSGSWTSRRAPSTLAPRQSDSLEIARALRGLADNFVDGRLWQSLDEAEILYIEAIAMFRRLHRGDDHADVADSLNNLSLVCRRRGRLAAAEAAAAEAVAMSKRLHTERRVVPLGVTKPHCSTSVALEALGQALMQLGRLDEAEAAIVEAAAIERKVHGRRAHEHAARSLLAVAVLRVCQRRHDEAKPVLRKALEIQRELNGGVDDSGTAQGMARLGALYVSQGDAHKADKYLSGAVAMLRRIHAGRDHPLVADAALQYAQFLDEVGRVDDAFEHYSEALAVLRHVALADAEFDVATANTVAYDAMEETTTAAAGAAGGRVAAHRDDEGTSAQSCRVVACLQRLAAHLIGRCRYDDALPVCREALEMSLRLHDSVEGDHPHVAASLTSLGAALRAAGNAAEASRYLTESIAVHRRTCRDGEQLGLAAALREFACVCVDVGEVHEAEDAAMEAMALTRMELGTVDHADAAACMLALSAVHEAAGRSTEASVLQCEGHEMRARLSAFYEAPARASSRAAGAGTAERRVSLW